MGKYVGDKDVQNKEMNELFFQTYGAKQQSYSVKNGQKEKTKNLAISDAGQIKKKLSVYQ